MIFRQATPADIPALCDLLEMLFTIESDLEFDAENARRGFELFFEHPDYAAVFVAEESGEVIGMCSAQITISTAMGGYSAWIEDVILKPEFRGRGIMPQLLGELENWGRERGVVRLQNLCDLENAPALSFYEKWGARRTHLICFQKFL